MCYKIIIKIIIAVVFNTEKEKQLRGGGTELSYNFVSLKLVSAIFCQIFFTK